MTTANTLYDETIKYGHAKLLQSQVASNVASLDFTNMNTDYDTYLYELVNVANSVADAALNALVSNTASPTVFLTDVYYYWSRMLINLNSTGTGGPSNSTQTGPPMTQSFRLSTSVVLGTGVSGEVLVHRGPISTLHAIYAQLTMYTSANSCSTVQCGGAYWQGMSLGGIRFLFNSGNIANGRINQYGLKRGDL